MALRYHSLAGLICLLLCSCAGNSAAPDAEAVAREKLSIELLDCPSGAKTPQDIGLSSTSDGRGLVVTIQARSSTRIQAINCRLRFDPAHWQAGKLTPAVAWGAPDASLSLLVEKQPGVADIGISLANWDRQPGISADGALASVELLPAGGDARTALTAASPYVQTGALTINRPGGFLSWPWLMRGDYDLNGEVNISDLTALALHLGSSVDFADGGYQYSSDPDVVADGDLNGVVSIADVTQIGQFYGARISGFHLYRSSDWWKDYPRPDYAAPKLSPLMSIPVSQVQPATANSRPYFVLTVSEINPRGDYWWVVPYYADWEGSPSNSAMETGVIPPRQSIDYGLEWDGSTLSWTENFLGDYSLNSGVSYDDITSVGTHMNQVLNFPTDVRSNIVDGLHDGQIDTADLQAIGQSFGLLHRGFAIFVADSAATVPTNPFATPLIDPLVTWDAFADSEGRIEYVPDSLPSGSFVWVQPMASDSYADPVNFGVMSEVIQIP